MCNVINSCCDIFGSCSEKAAQPTTVLYHCYYYVGFSSLQIRSLVQQRGEQDRQLQVLEEELKKVEAKLLAAVREKTGLSASVTTLERQRTELKKVNEFLKNKVCLPFDASFYFKILAFNPLKGLG